MTSTKCAFSSCESPSSAKSNSKPFQEEDVEELSLRSWVVVQNLVGTPALNGSLARPTRAKFFIV